MHKIDCQGKACPQPVIQTKKALEKYKEVETVVDNTTAKENLKKLGKKLGCSVNVVDEGNEIFRVQFIKGEKEQPVDNTQEDQPGVSTQRGIGTSGKVILIDAEVFGKGEEELGKILIKGFIYTLTQIDPLPRAVVFINSGVKLATLNEEVIENLKVLEDRGVRILACGTCLDYYQLKEQLRVGQVSNMYEIVETLMEGEVVTI